MFNLGNIPVTQDMEFIVNRLAKDMYERETGEERINYTWLPEFEKEKYKEKVRNVIRGLKAMGIMVAYKRGIKMEELEKIIIE